MLQMQRSLPDVARVGKSCVSILGEYYFQPMNALEQAAARLEALGNPTRLTIYRLLVRAGEKGQPVGHIQSALGIAASTLSHHLKHLEISGLIRRRKDGVTHFCSAEYAAMDGLIAYLTEECCVDADEG